MKRSEKLALLTKIVNGQNDIQDIKRLKDQQGPLYMVVTDNGSPAPSDLVDTRLPDEQGRKRVPYADFLKNPVAYGNFCIIVTQQP